LHGAKENELTEARRGTAQRRGEREPDDRGPKDVFDAEPASEPASGIMIAAQSLETKGKVLVADLTVA